MYLFFIIISLVRQPTSVVPQERMKGVQKEKNSCNAKQQERN